MEIAALKEDHCNKEEGLKKKIALKDQLIKYVSLVQAKRKETVFKQTSANGNVCAMSHLGLQTENLLIELIAKFKLTGLVIDRLYYNWFTVIVSIKFNYISNYLAM